MGYHYESRKGHEYRPGTKIDDIKIPVIEDHPRNIKTEKQRKTDSKTRVKINSRIKELKELGFPREEALKRIQSEFSDSEFFGFFASWVDNVYKTKNYVQSWHDKKVLKQIAEFEEKGR